MTALPEDVRPYFTTANIGHLATVLPDGAPHSVPVWVDLEGDRIAILTSPKSRKARNIGRDPRVAISVTDRENWASMATVRGRITDRIDGAAGWAIVDRIAHKYIGQPYPRQDERVIYLIEPESVTTFVAG